MTSSAYYPVYQLCYSGIPLFGKNSTLLRPPSDEKNFKKAEKCPSFVEFFTGLTSRSYRKDLVALSLSKCGKVEDQSLISDGWWLFDNIQHHYPLSPCSCNFPSVKYCLALVLSLSLAWGQVQYVRQDALAFKATYYAPLDTLTMARFWETTAIHSEAMYNGNGSWGLGYSDWPTQPYQADHPLVRVVARHVMGLLTLIEAGLADPSAEQRAAMGLNWLMERQTEEGAWPLYTTNRGSVTIRSVYPTAVAGRAFSRAYRVLRNPRYLMAASSSITWQEHRPQDDSPFNHGLVLAGLLEHYRAVHEIELIEQAVSEGLIILNRQLPNGSWNDPDPLTTDEHALVTEALLMLEQALVEDHPQRRRVRGGVTAALNFLLENQLENGNFACGLDELSDYQVPTCELTTLILARQVRQMEEFDPPITGAVRALCTHPSNTGARWRGDQDGRFLAMANALVWFTRTQDTTAAATSTDELP